MWCLKGREGFCVYILPNEKKSFGKSQSNIKLEGDATISRLHAVVSVEPVKESETQCKCIINDVSKYGTFVVRDKKKIKLSSDKFVLKAGDVVQFGLKESIFVVLCHTFIIARSNLDEQSIKKLKDIVCDLKATLCETWENCCTHLTVAKSTLFTTKLAYALASAKPVVTMAYWEAVTIAVKESKELPKIEDFLPKVKEELLSVCSRTFLPNEKRSTLFKGLSFVHFCKKQYFTYASLITAAGGKSCVYPTKRPLTPRDLTAKNAIVIQQPASDSTQFTQVVTADYPTIYRELQVAKRRMISDNEIPLAILRCNTETYCNPKHNFATFFKLETQKPFSSNMIAENTQDVVNINTKQIKRKIIPETCESQSNETFSKKIRCFDENEKNISNVNITTQNINNRESKCKIIPETYDSQTNKTTSGSFFSLNESESKSLSDTNESNIATNNMQNVDNKEMKCKITDNLPNKQFQIIPDSCYSAEEDINGIFSKSNNKKDQIIFETCEFKEHVGSNFGEEQDIKLKEKEEQQNIKLQEKKIFKEDNATFAKNNQQENILRENEYPFLQQENLIMNEENNIIFEKKNLDIKKELIVRKDNLSDNNDKFTIARWEDSKNVETSHTVSIKEINDSKINIKQKRKNLFEKDSSRIEWQDTLEKQKFNSIFNSEKNQEDKKIKEEIQIIDNEKEKSRKTGGNKNLKQGFGDEILRKDVPCGKKFIKMFVVKPKKILKMDDFVL